MSIVNIFESKSTGYHVLHIYSVWSLQYNKEIQDSSNFEYKICTYMLSYIVKKCSVSGNLYFISIVIKFSY